MDGITKLNTVTRDFFYKHLDAERAMSVNTIRTYRDGLKMYLAFIGSRHTPSFEDFTSETVTDFLNDYEHDGKRGPRSRNQRLAMLKALAKYVSFRYPEDSEQMNRIRMIMPKKPVRRIVGYLERNEMDAVLEAAKAHHSGDHYYPLFLFMYHTGARVSEVAELTIGQLHLNTKMVLIHGKGNKDRVVPLEAKLVSILKDTISGREESTEAPVFLNRYGCKYSRRGIAYALKSVLEEAVKTAPTIGLKRISPHCIRHTTAMHLLQAKTDMNSIRLWLGHTSIETTNIYVETDPEMKRETLKNAHLEIPAFKPKKWKPTDNIFDFLESL